MHKTKVKTLWRGTTVSVNEFEVNLLGERI